ncbi:lysozyme inhibitor LprI family protein [Novosphingobium sp.]|uniref:lysozyme inhibitor LprI family protein n=1 Tax=Novosphingobium sp. TaxID=1874826 RepID=UPI003340E7B6
MLGLLASAAMAAATPTAADTWQQCISNTSTNAEWSGCGTTYLDRLDADLNVVWKKANAALPDQPSRSQLLEEQRAWLRFRDASCQVYASGAFGREGQVLHFVACRGEIIEARIATLKGITELSHQDATP